MEEECVEVLRLNVLEASHDTLTNLIFKFGVGVVWDTRWILVVRQSEFSLKEEVSSNSDRSSGNGRPDEVFAVMLRLTRGVHGSESRLQHTSDKGSRFVFLPGCSIENPSRALPD